MKRCIALLLAALICLSGCGKQRNPEPKGKSYFTYFDTVSYVFSYAGDSDKAFDANCAAASETLGRYHRLFDIYHEYADMNNLCTLNRLAGESVPLEDELLAFLQEAKDMYTLTNGQMNVMLGSVLRLWHEAREAASADPAAAYVPSDEQLREAARHTGIDLLEIDPEAGTARIRDPEAAIDVGAFGKGYAVERAAEALRARGAEGYVLNIGGNIRTIGTRPDGSGWSTGIRDPLEPEGAFALHIRLADVACVSSGVYERYFTAAGTRYHHIIDPDSLYPADCYASITVLAGDSGLADALSTALFCMDYEESSALVASLEGVEACWIFPDGSVRSSPGFAALIEEANEP